MTVTGVMKDIPGNSTFRYDMLTPLEFHAMFENTDLMSLENENYFVFVRLQKGTSAEELNEKIKSFVVENFGSDENVPVLRPFSRLHLYWLDEGGGTISQVRMVSIMAVFILLKITFLQVNDC